jgi:hypothetical protein
MVRGCAHAPFVELSFACLTEASIELAWSSNDINSSNARLAVAHEEARWRTENCVDRHHVATAPFNCK